MIELKVTGMTCEHCVGRVEQALEGVTGVTRVELVELHSGRALVEGSVDPQALVTAIEAAGYGAALLEP